MSDVCKALKIKEFKHCKGTAKALQNSKTLKIKHLMKFFAVLQSSAKNDLSKPTYPLGTIFACQNLVFSIYFVFTAKLQKQKTKNKENIERVGLGSFAVFFAVALQLLCSFLHICQKSTILSTTHRPIPCIAPSTKPSYPCSFALRHTKHLTLAC